MNGREPDWEQLRNITRRAEVLWESGQMDYGTWRSFVAEADSACHGYQQFTEFIFRYAKSEWLNRLMAEPKPKRSRKPKRAA